MYIFLTFDKKWNPEKYRSPIAPGDQKMMITLLWTDVLRWTFYNRCVLNIFGDYKKVVFKANGKFVICLVCWMRIMQLYII